MAFGGKLKSVCLAMRQSIRLRIEKLKDTVRAPIDVLDLLLTKVSAERPDFFFVQIGANNGLTDDPIRQFVTKYHWHGVLVEPQPQVLSRFSKTTSRRSNSLLKTPPSQTKTALRGCSSRTIGRKPLI